MKQHIYLIGFMGTGKTTISHKLRELTGAKEIDMDAWIVEKNALSINEMFEKYGETYFRDRETGAVLRQENTQMMKESGRIVLLTATPETVYKRVKNSTDRPLLNGHMNVEYIASLMEKRRALYAGACDISVSTDGKTPEQIAMEILAAAGEM